MTNREQERLDAAQRLADLQAALDAYGADRTRWPAPVRHELSSFIASSAEAQRVVRDAEAFDRLLDHAPTVSPERIDALAARIAALAERQPRITHQSRSDAAVRSPKQPNVGFGRSERGWAGAALAASLALGVLVSHLPAVESASSALIAGASYEDTPQLAQTDEAGGLMDEDLL
ncbi:MAG: hypothetical protein ACT4OU_06415 [Hyphomicrobium sp.]